MTETGWSPHDDMNNLKKYLGNGVLKCGKGFIIKLLCKNNIGPVEVKLTFWRNVSLHLLGQRVC